MLKSVKRKAEWHTVILLLSMITALAKLNAGNLNNATPAAPSPNRNPVPTATASVERIKNPFAYDRTDNDQGLIPVSTGRLPRGIRLATVLLLGNGDAIAALRLPGEETPVYVRVDDLISVDFHRDEATKKKTASPTVASSEPVYLLIKSISATGVEVAPRVRPSELHLIR